MKACIYLRVSTTEQDPENQLSDCMKYCEAKGYEVVKIYKEQSSAWDKRNVRKQFELMLEDARKRLFKHIIVWDYDRFYRNRKKLVETVKGYKKIGIEIHSCNQSYFDELYKLPTPFDEIMIDFLLQFIGWMGEAESDLKSKRVRIAYKNHKGKTWGRPSVSNYKKRKILALRSEGKSLGKISEIMGLGKSTVHKIISAKT